MGDIARQGNDSKVQLVSWEVVEEGRARYRKVDGADPPYAERPTREQITILWALLQHLTSMFVDFAIFVPWGDRALQDRLFDSCVISGAGVLVKMKLHGPPSFVEWLACYKIFRSLCLVYNVIDNGFLKRYAAKIQEFCTDYPGSWGLIYQVDVRTRQEHAPRVLADAQSNRAEALAK